ncbi:MULTISPECIES: DUF5983 family protein [Sphingobium]|uniref:DUF5983 family protein n=1 Tax=Sphingobium TaxID=165695 RepID=UPI0020A316D6|nr:hypothetical protein [Sphingobium indicum]
MTRACAAIQFLPGHDPARMALIQDLTEASQNLGALGDRWPIEIHVGTIEHSEGVNGYVGASRSELMEKIGEFCREWWDQINDNRDPATLGDEEVASVYSEKHPEDHVHTDRVQLEAAWPSASGFPIETGQYCVLGIGHLSMPTADVLDQWCSEKSDDRPLPLAETPYGWFIPTREVDEATRADIPADLLAVMQFGRERGFEHVLIDRDAGTTDDLPLFTW